MNQQEHILNELHDLSPILAALPRGNVFTVPEGYFEFLATDVLFTLQKQHAAFPAIPEGYFENFAGTVLSRIKAEAENDVVAETKQLSEMVAGIGKKNVYTVPAGYFENNEAGFLAQNESVAQETARLSALVAGIGNGNVFNVPEGYFENLQPATTAPAKLVNMGSRMRSFKYAVAAALTGIIGVSIILMFNKKPAEDGMQTAAVMQQAKEIISKDSFDETLNTLSDDAIVHFLESKGQDVEAALVASLTEEKELPDAMDYMIDENVLDDMLKSVDLTN